MADPPISARAEVIPEPPVVPLDRREILFVFAFWTVFALLTAANRWFDPRTGQLTFSTAATTLAFVESYLWACLTPPIFWLSSRLGGDHPRRLARALVFLAVGLCAALFVDLAVEVVRALAFPPPRRRGTPFEQLWTFARFRYLNDLVIYLAVLAAGSARDYFLRYRARREESVRLEAHAAQLQAQLAEARLDVLRTQLNPHFLFNTLHAVSSLVERDPRGVRRMIARLSELLRYTLEGSPRQEIPLREELELLRRYLEIMELRFQGRIETSIDVPPEVLDALVPNLILQPLVENAMKHGVSDAPAGGRIEVRARLAGENVVLTVCDTGHAGATPEARESTGVGLRNTRERLEQLYGPHQRFTLRPVANGAGGTIAEIVLPYHTQADLHASGLPVSP